MRVLVTGGAGFIGSHIVDELVRLQHDVVVVDDLDPAAHDGMPDGLSADADYVWRDVRDPSTWSDVLVASMPSAIRLPRWVWASPSTMSPTTCPATISVRHAYFGRCTTSLSRGGWSWLRAWWCTEKVGTDVLGTAWCAPALAASSTSRLAASIRGAPSAMGHW